MKLISSIVVGTPAREHHRWVSTVWAGATTAKPRRLLSFSLGLGIFILVLSAFMDGLRWVLQEWYVPSYAISVLCVGCALLMGVVMVLLRKEEHVGGESK